jgi:hypothetical protein
MCYWRLRQWILKGGKLLRTEEDLDNTWYQLTKIKYRQSIERMRGRCQIMSKEDMLKDGVESPDVADALMMTFLTEDVSLPSDQEEYEEERRIKDGMDKYRLFPT